MLNDLYRSFKPNRKRATLVTWKKILQIPGRQDCIRRKNLMMRPFCFGQWPWNCWRLQKLPDFYMSISTGRDIILVGMIHDCMLPPRNHHRFLQEVAAWFTGANSLPTSNFPSVLQVAGIFAVTGGSEIAVCGYGHDLHSQHLQNKMIQLSHEMRRWMGVKMGEQPSTTCSLWDRWLPTFTVAISSGINIILRLPGF